MNSKTTFAALVAMAVTLSVAMLVSSLATPVQAQGGGITPGQPARCENRGGNTPQGQQDDCQGEGLIDVPATPATNPTGRAPPGQN